MCWKVWVWGCGSAEGGGSEVLLRARVLCCVGARLGMRSWQSMVQVAANTKTSRVCAAVPIVGFAAARLVTRPL